MPFPLGWLEAQRYVFALLVSPEHLHVQSPTGAFFFKIQYLIVVENSNVEIPVSVRLVHRNVWNDKQSFCFQTQINVFGISNPIFFCLKLKIFNFRGDLAEISFETVALMTSLEIFFKRREHHFVM